MNIFKSLGEKNCFSFVQKKFQYSFGKKKPTVNYRLKYMNGVFYAGALLRINFFTKEFVYLFSKFSAPIPFPLYGPRSKEYLCCEVGKLNLTYVKLFCLHFERRVTSGTNTQPACFFWYQTNFI